MSEKIIVNNKEYIFVKNYRDESKLRVGLNELTQKIYGFNFEMWYEAGYWGEGYIPYSLLDDEKLVANVSVSIMKVNVLGEEKRYIQIGTVMTDEEYRNQGLSKILIEKILKDWEEKCDCIYLFANDNVLDFYPKFGFEKAYEYQYSVSRIKETTDIRASKLNIYNIEDKQLIEGIIDNSIVNSKIYDENNKNLIMFYCLGFLKECIYYIKEYNLIAICEYEENILNINNIFCDREFDLDKIINILMDNKTEKVNLGFTPINTTGYEKSVLNDDNDTLFILKDTENVFKNNHLMFPTLSHA